MLTKKLKEDLQAIINDQMKMTPEKKKAIAPSRPEAAKQAVDQRYHAQPGQT